MEDRSVFNMPRVETIKVKVIAQTVTNRLSGSIHLRENERIKDALNTSDDFIALTGVRVFDISGLSLFYETPFLAINRKHLVWIIEDGGNLGVSTQG